MQIVYHSLCVCVSVNLNLCVYIAEYDYCLFQASCADLCMCVVPGYNVYANTCIHAYLHACIHAYSRHAYMHTSTYMHPQLKS